MTQNEIGRILIRYAAEKKVSGRMDLESFAMSIRSSRHEIGGRMLEVLANADAGEYQGWTLPWG